MKNPQSLSCCDSFSSTQASMSSSGKERNATSELVLEANGVATAHRVQDAMRLQNDITSIPARRLGAQPLPN